MNRVEKAVILAAGAGKRMHPITLKTPKPLVQVNGLRMIDTVIRGLHENGISEIYIVVGYKKEQFRCLLDEYQGITLIENPCYDVSNNISSLYAARWYLENSIILDGDQIIFNSDILSPEFEYSGYNAVWTEKETNEWLMTVEDGFVRHCSRNGGKRGWQLYSISRWSAEDGKKLCRHLEIEFEKKKNTQIYWDDIVMFCYPQEYQLGIRQMQEGDLIEIDELKELAALDAHIQITSGRGIRTGMGGNKLKSEKGVRGNIDPVTTAVPLAVVLLLCISFTVCPEVSAGILMTIRGFLGDTLGIWYLAVGLAVLLISFWIAFSDIGKITLGEKGEKPKYGFLAWGAMIFTCGLAADILFYSFCEWICYAQEPHVSEAGSVQDWASTYPLFHWGPIPWSFYAVLAACFGFMLHVRNVRKQKYSEACRPLLGSQTDRGAGKIIDILAVIALIAGTTTTFSVATPLLSAAIADLAGIQSSKYITIMILVITCFIYTFAVMKDLKGVSGLANICMYLFGALLIYVLVFGGETRYILETGFSAVGNMIQNFIVLSTWTDALRVSSFPQNWTIFYWAYWMVWCVASPFFMGSISRGRTVKQVILGAYTFGLGSTLLSFIILGNYGLGLQMTGRFDGISFFNQCGDLYQTVMAIIRTLPACPVFLILLTVSMIAFYATSFDSITLVASQYSYREFREGEKAGNGMKFFWAVLLILLPVTFVFSESSMKNMQTLSIIAAFPVSIVIILIIVSFVKDAKKYLYEEQ